MSEYKVSVKIAGQLEKSFNSALQGAQKGLEGLGSLGVKSVQLAAKSLTAAGAAIGAVGVASVNVGREFEAQMSSTAATAGATEEEYKKLEAAAMECGRTTSKTATESSAALEYMALAGWSVNDSISALPSVLRLSEATGLDLARTSDLVTDSMSACGVSVDNLAGYLDICAKANNKSNQTAEQLMEAYLGVGGVMTNLNVPLTESATALGVLANRGIKGSEAGNALNAIMANLTTGTGQAGEMMKSLGISAFDSEGKFIGLKATLETLNTALSGCTEEERNAALAAIGGKQHVDALNDLMSGLNTTLEDGSTEWENLTKELENCDGALEAMAQTKLDNLNGDLAIFQSALEDTGIKIYKNLQGPLREVVQFGTDQIYRLSDALADGGFQGMAETLGDVLADCVTEVANYAPQLVTMASTLMSSLLRGLVDNAPTLTSAAATLATSIITAIVQYIAEFYTTGATLLAQFLQGMVGKMPEIIQAGITATQNLSQGILSQFPTIVSAALQIGTQLINGLAVMLPTLLNMGIQMVVQLALGIAQQAPQIITAGVNLIFQLANTLLSSLPQLVSAGLTLVQGIAMGIVSGLQYIFVALVSGLIQAIPTIGQACVQIPAAIIEAIFTTDWIQVGADLIKGIGEGIINAFGGLVDSVKGLWSDFVGWFTGDGEEAGTAAGESVAAGIDASTPSITASAQNASLAAQNGYQIDTSLLTQYGTNMNASLAGGIDASSYLVQTAAGQSGTDAMTSLNNSLVSMQGTLNTTAQGTGTETMNSLLTGLQSQQGALDAGGLAAGTSLTNGMSTGVATGSAGLQEQISALSQTATSTLSSTIDGNLPGVTASATASASFLFPASVTINRFSFSRTCIQSFTTVSAAILILELMVSLLSLLNCEFVDFLVFYDFRQYDIDHSGYYNTVNSRDEQRWEEEDLSLIHI